MIVCNVQELGDRDTVTVLSLPPRCVIICFTSPGWCRTRGGAEPAPCPVSPAAVAPSFWCWQLIMFTNIEINVHIDNHLDILGPSACCRCHFLSHKKCHQRIRHLKPAISRNHQVEKTVIKHQFIKVWKHCYWRHFHLVVDAFPEY